MNKNRYRIIFNKARGMFMAVAENAKSQSKNSGQSVGTQDSSVETEVSFNQLWQVKALVLSLSILTPFAPLYAQVQADQSAGINQRAVIAAGKTPSGQVVPVVNIQTPKNGVSHNVYQSFDVLNEGLVLNNSRTGARSQLVQSVAANPLLQKGEARVILNEVKGGASRFEGNLEVAGQMADVIIANPAGINIKGGGFINTNRATLTTGTPVLNADGSIQKYNIQQGKVSINAQAGSSLGLGGKQNNANYVDIYTRALDLNAQMHVNADALVVTGANEIDEKTQRAVVQDAKTKVSNFAIDAKKLGGMYAENIYLIATEQGLGVQNYGTLQAKKNLVITSAGKIENRWGTIETTDQKEGILSLQTTSSGVTGDINSDGLIQSPNLVSLNSSNDINIYHNHIKTTQDNSRIQLIADKNINLKPDGKITKEGALGVAEFYGKTVNLNTGASITSEGHIGIFATDKINLEKNTNLTAKNDILLITNKEIKVEQAKITTDLGNLTLQNTKNESDGQFIKGSENNITLNEISISLGDSLVLYNIGNTNIYNPIINLKSKQPLLSKINIYTGENLVWSNPIKRLPLIAGNLNVQAQGEANLEQTNLETIGNLTVNANAVKLPKTLKSQSDLVVTTQNSDLNVAGKSLEAQDQLELTALKGHVQAQGAHLNSKDAGINIYAQKDIDLTPQEANTAQLNAQSDIKVVNLEQGNIRLQGTQIKSTAGDILVDSKQDLQAFEQKDKTTSLQGQDITLKSNRNIDLNRTDLNAQKNINMVASQDAYLKGVMSRSGQNTLIKAGDHLYLNSQSNGKGWVDWNAVVTPRKSELNSQGLLSLNSGKHQFIRNTDLKGGAVITNAGWSLQTQGPISFTAQKTDSLAKDAIYKPFNGSLQIQSSDHLTINPHVHLLSSNGDIALTSKVGKLTLEHTDTKDVNLQTAGNIRLQGADLDLQQTNLKAGQGISITTKKETPQKADEGQLDIKGSRIESIQGNVSISANGRLNIADENNKRTTIQGKDVVLSSAKNTVQLKNTDINSKGTTEIKSADFMALHNTNLTAGEHIFLDSKRRLYVNAINNPNSPAILWGSEENHAKLKAQGVISLRSNNPLYLKNIDINGGAVILKTLYLYIPKKYVNINAVETNFLQQNAKPELKALNGTLIIDTKKALTLDPRLHHISADQNINVNVSDEKLTLVGHAGKTGNGSEEVFNLASKKGSISLYGAGVDIQGSKIEAQKDLNIIASMGDLRIDGIKNITANQLLQTAQVYKEKESLQKIKQYYEDLLKRPEYYVSEREMMSLRVMPTPNEKRRNNVYKERNKIVAEKEADIRFFESKLNGYEHAEANLVSNTGNINLLSAQGVSISGADFNAQNGLIDIEAMNPLNDRYTFQTKKSNGKESTFASIIIDGHTNFYDKGKETDENYQMRTKINPTTLSAAKGVNIRAVGKSENDNLVLQATEISSPQGNVNIEANKNIILDAGLEQSYDHSVKNEKRKSWGGLKRTTTTTMIESNKVQATGVDIHAKNILIESKEQNPNVNVDIYSADLKADGGNITVKSGGNINFYTVEEQDNSNIEVNEHSSFIGIKYDKSKTNSTRNQVDALPAKLTADYIGTKSGFDTRLEGTEFNYLKGATIEAGGKLTLLGAKSTISEATKTENNYVVWQKTQDKGLVQETAKLPTFNGSGIAPVFKAAGGLEVQIPINEKDAGKKQIRDEILKLAKQPGNEYLNDLVKRNDVNWQEIILAQKEWDYKSQGLTGVGAAIVAIAIACVTAGAGAAISGAVAGAAGGGATGTALGAAAGAGFTSIVTQASISLINNGGDIKATFKDLGSKDSVKGLVVTMITAGAMRTLPAGVMNKLSTMQGSQDFVTKLSGHMGQSLLTSSVATGIDFTVNGGSLKDKVEKMLISSATNSLQASLSNVVGVTLDIENKNWMDQMLHKLAHAAVGCATGAIQKSCEAGALGAVTGEIVAGLLPENTDFSPEGKRNYREKILAISKATAGALSSSLGYDFNIAINSADKAVSNNFLYPAEVKQYQHEFFKCGTDKTCKENLLKNYQALSTFHDKEILQKCKQSGADCSTILKAAMLFTAQDFYKENNNNFITTGGIVRDSNNKAIETLESDRIKSRDFILDSIFNNEETVFKSIDNINSRVSFFKLMYEKTGSKWFDVATTTSIQMLGGGGLISKATFQVGKSLSFGENHDVEKWRAEAGTKLMEGGFNNFKDLYSGKVKNINDWNMKQLYDEQHLLQDIHERYFLDAKVNPVLIGGYIVLEGNAMGRKISSSPLVAVSLASPTGLGIATGQFFTGNRSILRFEDRMAYGCSQMGLSGQGLCAQYK